MKYVTIREKWTRTTGWIKIGDGPWRPIDLTPYGGKPPVIFLNSETDWVIRERWEAPQGGQEGKKT